MEVVVVVVVVVVVELWSRNSTWRRRRRTGRTREGRSAVATSFFRARGAEGRRIRLRCKGKGETPRSSELRPRPTGRARRGASRE